MYVFNKIFLSKSVIFNIFCDVFAMFCPALIYKASLTIDRQKSKYLFQKSHANEKNHY